MKSASAAKGLPGTIPESRRQKAKAQRPRCSRKNCFWASRQTARILRVKLVFQGVRLLRGQHAEELELEANMVVAVPRIGRHFQPECPIERRQVRQPVRLKEGVGLEIRVLDFIHGTAPARRMAEGARKRRRKGLLPLHPEFLQQWSQDAGSRAGGRSGKGRTDGLLEFGAAEELPILGAKDLSKALARNRYMNARPRAISIAPWRFPAPVTDGSGEALNPCGVSFAPGLRRRVVTEDRTPICWNKGRSIHRQCPGLRDGRGQMELACLSGRMWRGSSTVVSMIFVPSLA